MNSYLPKRCEKIRQAFVEAGLEAMIITNPASRFYVSGFELHDPQADESSGIIVLMANGKHWLCTDARYLDAAKRLWAHDRILIYGRNAATDIAKLIADHTKGTIGFEARTMKAQMYLHFTKLLSLQAADDIIIRCRAIKDASEIAAMRKACNINHELMNYVPTILDVGRSEADIAWDIEAFFRTHGASELAFHSIVAFNTNAALPHARPSKDALLTKESHVLVDVGCRCDDYCSDQTRTFWFGDKPEKRFLQTLEWVQEAQSRATSLVKPGVLGRELYHAANDFFISHKVEHLFTHALGHGIGIDTHECVSLHSQCEESLEAGMVITIEPGLYEATWGGIRWEHMVLLTPNGYEIF